MVEYENEIIDIVDEHDRVLSTMDRSQAIQQAVKYRRVVLAFITDNQGAFCFFKRSAHKSYDANYWSLVGGGVHAGESYDDAIRREVAEEIGITQWHSLRLLGTLAPGQDDELFKSVYEIVVDPNTISCNPDDFSQYRWCLLHELIDLAQHDLVFVDLPGFINRFYPLKHEQSHKSKSARI